MSEDAKNYEIAYILTPALPEGEVVSYAGKITAAIEDAKGVIKKFEEPKKRKLGYPIKKRREGYFGWATFRMAPIGITEVEKRVKTDEHVLRHLILEEEIETKPQGMLRVITSRPVPGKPKAVPRAPEKTDEKLDLEELDKKLEEILGK